MLTVTIVASAAKPVEISDIDCFAGEGPMRAGVVLPRDTFFKCIVTMLSPKRGRGWVEYDAAVAKRCPQQIVVLRTWDRIIRGLVAADIEVKE